MRTPTWVVVGLIGLLLGYLAWAWHFWFVTDDAFITFRYSRMWSEGHGVRFNPGDHVPVEGYSNFLWMVIAAGFHKVGIEPPTIMPVLSLLSGMAFVVYLWRHSQDRFGFSPWIALIVAAALALSPGMVVWATGGLATMPAAYLLFVLFDRWVLSDEPGDVRVGGVAALLLALLRTEGIGWVVVCAALAWLVRKVEPSRRPLDGRAVARVVVGFGVVYGSYYLWRYLHFGTLVSNTAMAKVDFGTERVLRGGQYVGAYWLEMLTPPFLLFFGTLVSWRAAKARGLAVAAMAFGVPLYAVLVGGDFMTMGRLLVPGMAFQAILLGFLLRDADRASAPLKVVATGIAAAVITLGVQPLNNVQLVPKDVRKTMRVRFNTTSFRTEYQQWAFMRGNSVSWSNQGKALKAATKPGESLVLGAIGAVSYYSDLFIYDRFGLVTREVTERESARTGRRHSPGHDKAVRNAFFIDDEPTYIWSANNRERGLPRVAQEARSFASSLIREHYGPVVKKAEVEGETFYVTLMMRMDDPEEAWASLDARVGALMADAAGLPVPTTDAEDEASADTSKDSRKRRRRRKRKKQAVEGQPDDGVQEGAMADETTTE